MAGNEISTLRRTLVTRPQTIGLEGAGALSKGVLLDEVGPVSGPTASMESRQITGGSAALSQGQQTTLGVTPTVSSTRTDQEGRGKSPRPVIHFWTGQDGLLLPAGQFAEPSLLTYRTTTREEREDLGQVAASGTNKRTSSLQLESPNKLVCIY